MAPKSKIWPKMAPIKDIDIALDGAYKQNMAQDGAYEGHTYGAR